MLLGTALTQLVFPQGLRQGFNIQWQVFISWQPRLPDLLRFAAFQNATPGH